uniref:Glycoprotein M6B n=1 Tax=Felis catus TaxID=9685 RepID=A0ABI7VZ01_FELCA
MNKRSQDYGWGRCAAKRWPSLVRCPRPQSLHLHNGLRLGPQSPLQLLTVRSREADPRPLPPSPDPLSAHPLGFSGPRATSAPARGSQRKPRAGPAAPARPLPGSGPRCGRTKPPALTSGPLSARPAPSAGGAAPRSHPGPGASSEPPAAGPAAQQHARSPARARARQTCKLVPPARPVPGEPAPLQPVSSHGIQLVQYVIYGIASFFFLYGIILLAEGFYTTSAVKELHGEFKTTACGRCISGMFVFLTYVLGVAWLGVFGFSAVPVFMFYNIWSTCEVIRSPQTNGTAGVEQICVDIRQYGIIPWNAFPGKICGSALENICNTNEFYVSYHLFIVACAGAGATVIALLIYMMATTYNYAVLKFKSREDCCTKF